MVEGEARRLRACPSDFVGLQDDPADAIGVPQDGDQMKLLLVAIAVPELVLGLLPGMLDFLYRLGQHLPVLRAQNILQDRTDPLLQRLEPPQHGFALADGLFLLLGGEVETERGKRGGRAQHHDDRVVNGVPALLRRALARAVAVQRGQLVQAQPHDRGGEQGAAGEDAHDPLSQAEAAQHRQCSRRRATTNAARAMKIRAGQLLCSSTISPVTGWK
jgi:hypothetical protein